MKMKLNPNSILPLISKHEVVHPTEVTRDVYDHPWHQHVRRLEADKPIAPNPPTQEAVERAKFIDKTYVWNSGADSIRPRNKRSTK